MAKFIELHAHSDNDRLYINTSNIGYIEDRKKDGAIVHMCGTSFTRDSGCMQCVYVTETYNQVKAKIND